MSAEAQFHEIIWMDAFITLEKTQQCYILDLAEAEKILETEHYGLKEVKERIIEYLAVQQRVKKLKGPILCLVGLQVLVKHHWVNLLQMQQDVNLCVCH